MEHEQGRGALPPQWSDLAELARADAQERTGVDAARWRVRSVQPEIWSSSALGLPEPGQAYLTVMTPGCRLTLEFGDRVLRYHCGMSRVKFAGEGLGDPQTTPTRPRPGAEGATPGGFSGPPRRPDGGSRTL